MSEKIEFIEKKILKFQDDVYEVVNAFSHDKRNYISIDIKDINGNPYVICDSGDIYYGKIQKIKVHKNDKNNKNFLSEYI